MSETIGVDEATEIARTFAAEHLTELGERNWRPTAFDGGWLMRPEGDDLRWTTGVPWLVVLGDRSVHRESSSMAPSMVIEKYQARPA